MQQVRFFLVGGGVALLFFALITVFAMLGVAPLIGNILAYLIAFAVAYPTQRNWTFQGTASHSHALPRYLAVQLFCALASGVLGHVAAALGIPILVTAALVTLAASGISYVLSSRCVFSPPPAI